MTWPRNLKLTLKMEICWIKCCCVQLISNFNARSYDLGRVRKVEALIGKRPTDPIIAVFSDGTKHTMSDVTVEQHLGTVPSLAAAGAGIITHPPNKKGW